MSHARRTPLVLIADDDPGARLLQSAALEGGGFDVITAEDGPEAVELFQQKRPDCLVLDVMMPGMSGFDVCRKVRALPYAQHTPILIVTSLDDLEAIGEAYAAGATDFAQKGLAPLVLLERIRFLTRAGALQQSLLESEARLAEAQRIARIGHWEITPGGATVAISPVALEMLGLTVAEARSASALTRMLPSADAGYLKQTIEQAFKLRQPFTLDVRTSDEADGRYLHIEGQAFERADNAERTLVLTLQDLTPLRRAEENARLLAYFDAITGLPNIAQLRNHLQQTIAEAQAQHVQLALISCDIEQFHRYNESGGMEAGNALLIQIGQRMQQQLAEMQSGANWTMRQSALVARLGGDEFALLLPMQCSFERFAELLESLQSSIQKPLQIGAEELPISMTMGVVLYPDDGDDAQTLIRHAGAALHQAKQTRRGGHVFYSARLQEQAARRLSLEADLRRAISRGQMEVWYQPRIALATMAPLGCEALVRWRHPERGLISPGQFIPLAEELGLIIDIGEWVLEQACAAAARWRADGMEMSVAVNISAVQMQRTPLVDRVDAALRAHALAPQMLELEITEGVLIDVSQPVRRTLELIKERGVRIALDDFGTGYSSLSYLRQLPIDCLKIDRAFVSDLDGAADGGAIVKVILALARALKLRTVAEGVETLTQFDFLAAHDCDEIQGFLFARPMPEPELRTWWSKWLSAPPRREQLEEEHAAKLLA